MFSSRSIRWAVALSLLLVTATGCLWFLLRSGKREAESTAYRLVEEIRKTLRFTPEITVNRTLYLHQHTPVLELVTSRRTFQHRMEWQSTWLGSTKEITLEGDFTARTGFDLHEPFRVDVDSRTRTVRISHPRPRLLAVEMASVRTSQSGGWWNGITDDDRNDVLTRFTADARASLERDPSVLENAREELHRQLKELLGKSGYTVEFLETLPPPEQSPK